MINRKLSFNDTNDQYMRAKRNIGIVNDTSKIKLSIQGENALGLINNFANSHLNEYDTCKCVGLYKNKKFIDEAIIFQINPKYFILLINNEKKVVKMLKKVYKSFPFTIVNNISNQYSLFSFHGKNAITYFNNYKAKYLFKVNQQGYTYYHLLTPKKDEVNVLNYFLSQKFTSINLETKKIFLYNNKVINNFQNISWRFKSKLIHTQYPLPNENSEFAVEIFEALDHSIISKNTKILNYKRNVCGVVCYSFKLPCKKYPFLLGLVSNSNNNILIINSNKKEILIRKLYTNYETS